MAALTPAARAKIDSMQRSAQNARSKVRELEAGLVRKSVISITGATLALSSKKNVMPLEIGGVPTKLGLALGFTLVEAMSRGSMRRMAGAAGDACLAVYTHEAVQAGGFVGEDDPGGGPV